MSEVTPTPGLAPNGTDVQAVGRVRTHDQFFDRDGKPITVLEWAALRSDPTYCRVGYWEGEGGAWIYTFWLGLDVNFGAGGEVPLIFDTHGSAFGNQPYAEWNCPSDTLERAQLVHQRVIEYVAQGITPDEWTVDDLE